MISCESVIYFILIHVFVIPCESETFFIFRGFKMFGCRACARRAPPSSFAVPAVRGPGGRSRTIHSEGMENILRYIADETTPTVKKGPHKGKSFAYVRENHPAFLASLKGRKGEITRPDLQHFLRWDEENPADRCLDHCTTRLLRELRETAVREIAARRQLIQLVDDWLEENDGADES